jgi:hypothetical protein
LPTYNSCGLGFVEGGVGALDFGEDFGAFGLPLVELWIGVALGERGIDGTHQFADRGEAAGAYPSGTHTRRVRRALKALFGGAD